MYLLFLTFWTLVGVNSATVGDQRSALEILRKVMTVRSISYKAEVETIRLKPQVVSAKAVLYFKVGKRRLVYENEPATPFIILDDGESVYQLQPRWRTVIRMPIVPQRIDFELLLRNYEVKFLGSEQIAGRDCYVIIAQPKHSDNPMRKVWVDKTYFVILRHELIDSDGTPVRIFVVKSVDFDAEINDSLFKVPPGWRVLNAPYRPISNLSLKEVERLVRFKVLLPQFVPEGYQLIGVGVTYCQHGTPIAHLRYSDGLNEISVFERPAQCRAFGRFRFGWGWRRQRGCDWLPKDDFVYSQIVNNLRVIVIGHPSQTVMQRIAESVK